MLTLLFVLKPRNRDVEWGMYIFNEVKSAVFKIIIVFEFRTRHLENFMCLLV